MQLGNSKVSQKPPINKRPSEKGIPDNNFGTF